MLCKKKPRTKQASKKKKIAPVRHIKNRIRKSVIGRRKITVKLLLKI